MKMDIKKHTFNLLVVLAILVMAPAVSMAGDGASGKTNIDNMVYMDLKDGRVTIILRPDLAPLHVKRIKTLVREGFYDGITFHRVIAGFMAQTGDPTGTGRGGSRYEDLPAEFSHTPFKRGTLGMARTQDPDSANSQFFICFADAPFLNGRYTVFGAVVDGMDFVDHIKKGDPRSGTVDQPDVIVKMQMAGDIIDK